MTKQEQLIGKHPINHPLGKWLKVNDLTPSLTKCHRELLEAIEIDDDLIEWMARKLIQHHYSDRRLEKLKECYKNLELAKYAEQQRKLPHTDKVKKGNATEILLIEYIQASLNKNLVHAYRFRYNPNVDQSMKGDDVLMIDKMEDKVQIYFGEAKFRQNSSKAGIDDISKVLTKDKMPLSYTYLVDQIEKTDSLLSDKLDKLIIKDIKENGDLIYAGLLFSDEKASNKVETHLNNDNPSLIFISIGVKNPQSFIDKIYPKAESLILAPEDI